MEKAILIGSIKAVAEPNYPNYINQKALSGVRLTKVGKAGERRVRGFF